MHAAAPPHALRPADPADRNQRDSIERLVRTLVREASISQSPEKAGEGSDILLDLIVDGTRCVLLRVEQRQPEQPHQSLSPREVEIARMVAKGLPNKAIAAVLDISTWTVGTHMRRVFAKLGVGSRAAMVARLAEHGVIESRTHRNGHVTAAEIA